MPGKSSSPSCSILRKLRRISSLTVRLFQPLLLSSFKFVGNIRYASPLLVRANAISTSQLPPSPCPLPPQGERGVERGTSALETVLVIFHRAIHCSWNVYADLLAPGPHEGLVNWARPARANRSA